MTREDLQGKSLADVLELLEAGRIGHSLAMDWTGAKTFGELVELMHYNGRRMPGHREMIVTDETRKLLLSITRPRNKKPARSIDNG